MAGREQGDGETGELPPLAEIHEMLQPLAGQARLHEPAGAAAEDHFAMITDVIGVRVGDKGERLLIPRIEPEAARGEFDAPVEARIDHTCTFIARRE